MEESHQILMGIEIRFFVDERYALCFQTVQFLLDVVHLKRYVMDPLPPLLKELGYVPLWCGGLQELNVCALQPHKGEKKLSKTLLLGNGMPQSFGEKGTCFFEIFNRQTDMADFFDHRSDSPPLVMVRNPRRSRRHLQGYSFTRTGSPRRHKGYGL